MTVLDIEYLIPGHGFYVTGEDVPAFLSKSLETTIKFREKIEAYLNGSNGDIAAVVERIYQEEYVASGTILQPEKSYRINLEAKVKWISENRG
jgi:hypothetical protein